MSPNAERREAVILNAELRNFTRLSEMLPPEKVLELANDFFSLCAMAITANAGKVLSVQNDALVGAFATGTRKEYAHRALKSAQLGRGPGAEFSFQLFFFELLLSSLGLQPVFGEFNTHGQRHTGCSG